MDLLEVATAQHIDTEKYHAFINDDGTTMLLLDRDPGATAIICPAIPIEVKTIKPAPDHGRIKRVQKRFSVPQASATIDVNILKDLLNQVGGTYATISLCAFLKDGEQRVGVRIESDNDVSGYLMPVILPPPPPPVDLSRDTRSQAEGREFLKLITVVPLSKIDSLPGHEIEAWLNEIGYVWIDGNWVYTEE